MADYQLPQHESARKPQHVDTPVKERLPKAPSHPLMRLQAHAGNQVVARMIQRAGEEEELQMKHDASLQREDEVDEVEEEELQMKHDASLQRAGEEEELQMKHDASLQREDEVDEVEEEELQMKHNASLQRSGEEEELQMKHDPTPRVGLEGGPVGEGIETQINAMRGQGSGVPDGIRTQMESATGTDLSGVRVHQSAESDTLNRQLTAKAFTTGSDIFLRSDASTGDNHLMGHELAHVVQQSTGRTASSGGMTAGAANDPLEHEADKLAESVLSGTAQREVQEVTG